MQRLSWARHLKASKKKFIYVDILSPHIPTSSIIPYNVQMLTKLTCEQCIIICYWLSSGPRSVTFIGRASNVMKLLDRRISIKSGNFVYYYLFCFIEFSIVIRKMFTCASGARIFTHPGFVNIYVLIIIRSIGYGSFFTMVYSTCSFTYLIRIWSY